jgi:hypothetical protein
MILRGGGVGGAFIRETGPTALVLAAACGLFHEVLLFRSVVSETPPAQDIPSVLIVMQWMI